MSYDKQCLNFNDLKSQVCISSVTLNERIFESRKYHNRWLCTPFSLENTKQRCYTSSSSPDEEISESESITLCENMKEDSRNISYVRISPPPLEKVPRPQKLLFENKDSDEASSNKTSDIHRYNLTRKDFVEQETTSKNDFNMNVRVEVKPKYYQKWARSTRSRSSIVDTYNFPSLSVIQQIQKSKKRMKERIHSRKLSGQRKSRPTRLNSSGSLHNNDNDSRENVEAHETPIPKIEVSEFTENDADNTVDCDADQQTSSPSLIAGKSGSDSVESGARGGMFKTMDSCETDAKCFSHGYITVRSVEMNGNLPTVCNVHDDKRVMFKNKCETNTTHCEFSDGCSYFPKLLTFDKDLSESKRYHYTKNNLNYNSKRPQGTIEIKENNSLKSAPEKQNSQHEVTLSKQLISTECLEGASNRLPVAETRIESPFVYEKDERSSATKPTHYSYYPARPIYNDMHKRREKPTVKTRSSPFDFRRCKTDIGDLREMNMTHVPGSKVPIKLATSTPRFSIPDNLIVDFETLRIAAHIDKLQKSLAGQKVSKETFVRKSEIISTKNVPLTRNKGFRTVIIGSSVR